MTFGLPNISTSYCIFEFKIESKINLSVCSFGFFIIKSLMSLIFNPFFFLSWIYSMLIYVGLLKGLYINESVD